MTANKAEQEATKQACAIVQAADCPTDLIERITSALLKARADALEEILNHCVWQSDWYTDHQDYSKAVACDSIAAHIRALKERK